MRMLYQTLCTGLVFLLCVRFSDCISLVKTLNHRVRMRADLFSSSSLIGPRTIVLRFFGLHGIMEAQKILEKRIKSFKLEMIKLTLSTGESHSKSEKQNVHPDPLGRKFDSYLYLNRR